MRFGAGEDGKVKRLIVCGARDYPYYRVVEEALRTERGEIESVIEGEARGADSFARMACRILSITCHKFPADWETYGKAAGPVRNSAMKRRLYDYQGEREVWAFHTRFHESVGTKNMVLQAQSVGIAVRLYSGKSAEDWTYLGTSGKISLCPFCGGEKLRPALLAYKLPCRASWHGTKDLLVPPERGRLL